MATVSLATRVAAVAMGGTGVFGDLKPGDRFRFPAKRFMVFEKGLGGWYVRVPFTAGGTSALLPHPRPKFRTGSGTAVVKL